MIQLDHVFFTGAKSSPIMVTGRARRRTTSWVNGRPEPTSQFDGLEQAPSAAAQRALRGADQGERVDPFLSVLLSSAGVDAEAYKPAVLQRRLPSCLRALRARSTEDARTVLAHTPNMRPAALSSVLIGVSSFFRDPQVFQALHQSVLPALLRARRRLRVLSAGCSEGQELYSVAMLLDALGVLEESCLCGWDCRADAVATAEAGVYPMSNLSCLEQRWRGYFRRGVDLAQVEFRIRRKLNWAVKDLLTMNEENKWDLVLFRNVAIYMRPTPGRDLWLRVVRTIAPGGILVTGKAEKPPSDLQLERLGPCIYQNRSTGPASPVASAHW